jgi:hypothetical protein
MVSVWDRAHHLDYVDVCVQDDDDFDFILENQRVADQSLSKEDQHGFSPKRKREALPDQAYQLRKEAKNRWTDAGPPKCQGTPATSSFTGEETYNNMPHQSYKEIRLKTRCA